MKKYIFLVTCVLVVCLTYLVTSLVSANEIKFRQSAVVSAAAAKRIAVQAAGRGNPYINLEDGIELDAAYTGQAEMQNLLKHNAAEPRALASADIDEDGVPDLVCGYARPGGGIITLYRGNVDSIFPNSPEAQRRKTDGTFTDSAFLSPARVFEAPIACDFVGTGDFDADGHWDVVIAARDGKELWLLPGDGKGNFLGARKIELPGEVTSLITGEINRADGLTDIVVGVVTDDGPKALVFEGPEGALKAQPEVFSLPGEPRALALGQFDDDYPLDLAVGAGSELVIIHGRDRKLSLDEIRQAEVLPSKVERCSFDFEIRSIAAGDFTGESETSLALLASDGTVHLTKRQTRANPKQATKRGKSIDEELIGQWRGGTQLVRARVSTGPADDLIMLTDRHEIQILKTGISRGAATSLSAAVQVSTSIVLDGKPLSVLPMRVNADSLSDIVVLLEGHVAPAVVKTATGATFVVNTADDHDDGVCDSGDCTLREAIKAANANPGTDTIVFNIPGTGAHTISPTSQLPTITDSATIDGTTQPGFIGTPMIELAGNLSGNNVSGLRISAGNCLVRGLAITRFDLAGVLLEINGGNVIQGNHIGTDPTGTVSRGNFGWGMLIVNFSNSNTIGGTTGASRNVISGNPFQGLQIASSNNLVEGNFIGTDAAGTNTLGNSTGVEIDQFSGGSPAINNVIGGTASGARNIISGNSQSGVAISAAGNRVQGNFIGTDVNGAVRLDNLTMGIEAESSTLIGGTMPTARNIISGNGRIGVQLFEGCLVQGNFIGTDVTGTAVIANFESGIRTDGSDNIIGGTAPGAGNLISGNGFGGVDLSSSGNIVQGNLIGTDVTGTAALGNMPLGVSVSGSNNLIGGTMPGERNVISGSSAGIQIGGSIIPGPKGNLVQGNLIGTDASGAGPLPNTVTGVGISDSSNNTIGGIENGAGNVIAFNGRFGVAISSGVSNAILRNSIFSNGTFGIDLGFFNGVTPNDPCDADNGANNLQNFSVLTSAVSNGINTAVQGGLNSTANTTFAVEFFANDKCDPSGFGEGQIFIGSTTVTTDGSCNASFNVTLPVSVTAGQFITSTATDPDGNTSEFSNCVQPLVTCAITCPSDVSAAAPVSCPAQTVTVVNYHNPTSNNCPGATLTCSPPSGSTFPVGTTTVICAITDATGNIAQCTFTVSAFSFCLQDETNPGNVVMVNAQTGDYFFCCGGVPVASGRGTLNVKGCIGSIDHAKGDRRVHIQWDTSANNYSGAGTATVRKGPAGTDCQITDKNMTNNTCRCSNQPMQASSSTTLRQS
jgi:CSLREA domain-containing protein